MALIQPVSSLSIKRAVNLYTIILFLSFGVLLYGLALDRYQTFMESHDDKAHNTTRIVAFEISKTLREKQRVVDIFIESTRDLIARLAAQPDNEEIHHQISERLKRFQPDYVAFNIMTTLGEPIIGDFKGDIGEYCLDDVRDYIATGEQRIRLHPNFDQYHYDIKTTFDADGVKLIFFVSYNVDEISDILNSVQTEHHSLMLVNRKLSNLIEITPEGSRKSIIGRIDFRMTGDENMRVLAETGVKGTEWHIIDMRNPGLFSSYRNTTIAEFVIAYYIFSIIVLLMRNIILKQDEKRTTAELQLQENHKQIRELNDQLELLSKTDSLTGLYNRRFFDEIMQQEWNRGLRSRNPLSCILFDIDYFKDYNDCYGHQAGDECLKNVSLLMKDSFRRAGDIVARYGGEEFIVIMADSSVDETRAGIENFQRELAKLAIPHERSQISDCLTISAGFVNQVPSRNEPIEAFIRKADEALYSAKAGGRNQCVMHQA